MAHIHVFAGLGSDALFSNSTRNQAQRDSSTTQGRFLLETCHQTFIEEVFLPSTSHHVLGLDRNDFERPEGLLTPEPKYQQHPVIQNATLCLTHLLRYQSRALCKGAIDTSQTAAAAGFCAGLFAAVAVATAKDSIQYLIRAKQCFRLAVIVGLASENVRRDLDPLPDDYPWSVVVTNCETKEISDLAVEHNYDVFVSAFNGPACITISGPGRVLDEFVRLHLPSRCSVKTTNIYSPYHNHAHLGKRRKDILQSFEAGQGAFPSKDDLLLPLISTVDGSLIRSQDALQMTTLIGDVLDMILISRTDWVAVQNTIFSLARGTNTSSVSNYGPGYGALNHRKDIPPRTSVNDVSTEKLTSEPSKDDIAIVGVGLDLPDAPDLDALWENLMNGLNSCSEIPSDRFHVEDYYTGDGCKPVNDKRSMGTKYGNFLKDPFLFDNNAFGISPREAPSIDPQQRVVLTAVFKALDNAGYVPDSTASFSRETFGCFIGNATLDYTENLRQNIDVYYSPGTLRAFLSGRVAYAFKWSGPCATVDTACSSSLFAIYQAARALIAGDCRAAVAGGVNIITSPEMYLGLDKAHFLSPSGQCKAFDQAADGYCRSDGCAVFVLKRLADALAENDSILGVIKGVEVNQSGQASSITHPHSRTQDKLFRRLVSKANVDPLDVSVVEAHGTGTQAGDPNELRSIRGVFAEGRTRENPLYVTSIKSNVGHAEAASGGAGLAKLLVMLKHKRIPPQALLNNLNPAISDLGVDGTFIATEPRAWESSNKSRIALLNNFGAAGSNAALLLEEYQQPIKTDSPRHDVTYVFGCSARTPQLLEDTRQSLLAHFIRSCNELDIADVCYTSTARRRIQRCRLSVAARSVSELISKLERAPVSEAPETPRPHVFLFGGQGSQYLGMGKDLMELSPTFKSTVLRCHELLQLWGFPSCYSIIDPIKEAQQHQHHPETIQAFQTAVFVIEVALARLLADMNILPTIVAGHSLGEFAALVVAGVLDLESGLWLVAERARLIVAKCELWKTSMLAVNMPAAEVRANLLSLSRFSDLAISCENSRFDSVVGGNVATLKELQEHISSQEKKRCVMLDVPIAYHTQALRPMLEDFEAVACRVRLQAPTLSIASNALGRVVNPGENVFTPKYLVDQCHKTVAFDKSIADIVEKDADAASGIWIELGPHPTLLPMAASHLSSGTPDKLPALKKGQQASKTISDLLCVVYRDTTGELNWRPYFEGLPSQPRLLDFPSAPMDMRRYFVPIAREDTPLVAVQSSAQTDQTPYTLLQRDASSKEVTAFETPINVLSHLIKGHLVCDKALCPASVYAEMALAATMVHQSDITDDTVFKLYDINFVRPLLYAEESSDTIRIVTRPNNEGQGFEIFGASGKSTSDATVLHCSGKIKSQSLSKLSSKFRKTESVLKRRKPRLTSDVNQCFSAKVMYDKLFSRVVKYSSDYQAVRKIHLDDTFEEIYAQCELPQPNNRFRYAGQPVLLDTMLHVAGFAANLSVANDSVCIAHQVHSIIMLRKQIDPRHAFEVYCSNFTDPAKPDCIVADAYAVDAEGVIAIIKGIEFRRSKLAKIQSAFQYISQSAANADSKAPPAASIDRTRIQEAVRQEVPEDHERSPRQPRSDRCSISISEASQSTTLYSILSETTGVESKDITPRTELSAMGVDSMMVFELEKKLKEVLDPQPTVGEISACSTVRDIENLMSARMSTSTTPRTKSVGPHRNFMRASSRNGETTTGQRSDSAGPPPLEEHELPEAMLDLLYERLGNRIQPEKIQSQLHSSTSSPLYLFAPGAGITMHYNRMRGLQRDVYTVQDHFLLADSKDDWSSINEAAQHYASLVQKHATKMASHSDRIILGGWSFGGIIAFETARCLASQPDSLVRGVILIDAPPPFGHEPIAQGTIETAMAYTQKQNLRPRPKSVTDFEDAVAKLTIRNNLRRAALLRRYVPSRIGPMPRIILLRSSEGLQILNADHLPENKWLHDRSDVGVSVDAWEDLLGENICVIDIPGDHFHPFEAENVGGTTEAIRQACSILEER